MSRKASGLKAWAIQRITAVYIGLFGCYLLFALLFAPPENYVAWRDWFAHPVMHVTTLMMVIAILMHAWVGIRDILLDYIKPVALRIGLLVMLGFALLVYGLWAAQALAAY